jgi:hypothetical protein
MVNPFFQSPRMVRSSGIGFPAAIADLHHLNNLEELGENKLQTFRKEDSNALTRKHHVDFLGNIKPLDNIYV